MSRATVYRCTARSPVPFRISDRGLRMEELRLPPFRNPQSAIRIQPRSGLTLIEMLMATAITLLMMAAIVNLFATMTASISGRRAVIELNSQLRQVRQRLALDLAGCTVPSGEGGLMPWRQRPGEAIGYLEIVEGIREDMFPSNLLLQDTNSDGLPDIDPTTSIIPSSQVLDPDGPEVTDASGLGDFDDVLAMTVRSLDEPFVAEIDNVGRVESNLAEVLWYAFENPADGSQGEPGMRKIYRRVYLIAPWLPPGPNYDGKVSMHVEPGAGRVPNTLADLTRREYRAGRMPGSPFPHDFQYGSLEGGNPFDASHIVLSDALAFDVRVYDPGAPLFNVAGVVVQPGDPAWAGAAVTAGNAIGFGAYVDLGWDGDPQDYVPPAAQPTFFQLERMVGWHPVRFASDPTDFRGPPCVYDTWTWHYENDAVDQYGDGIDINTDGIPDQLVDMGRNGIDDDNANGVDDIAERETSPPYPVPLRGVKVILRTYERDARQVREVSVTNSFVP
jgi:hypothetical protein